MSAKIRTAVLSRLSNKRSLSTWPFTALPLTVSVKARTIVQFMLKLFRYYTSESQWTLSLSQLGCRLRRSRLVSLVTLTNNSNFATSSQKSAIKLRTALEYISSRVQTIRKSSRSLFRICFSRVRIPLDPFRTGVPFLGHSSSA